MRLRLSFILLNHIVVCSSWCEIHKKINFLGHMSILSTVYNYKKNYESEIWWNISLLFLLKILRDFFSEPCIACLFAGYMSLLKLHPICFLKPIFFILIMGEPHRPSLLVGIKFVQLRVFDHILSAKIVLGYIIFRYIFSVEIVKFRVGVRILKIWEQSKTWVCGVCGCFKGG